MRKTTVGRSIVRMEGMEKNHKFIPFALAGAAVLLAAIVLILGGRINAEHYPIRISELMARNESYLNSEGELCDWIELQNVSNGDFDLGGYSITDVPGEAKYVFPAGTILRAGEYMVIYCRSEGGEGYAPFGIGRAGGEQIVLENRTHTVLDCVVTLESGRDESQIRTENGLELCDYPSPGFENTESGHESALASGSRWSDVCPVVLSEILSSNSLYPSPDGKCRDIIELRNTADAPFNLSGYGLSDREDAVKYTFPNEAVIPANGCLVIWCGGEKLANTLWAPFGLSRDGGETVCLTTDSGALVDSVTIPSLGENQSFARGGSGWYVKLQPDPGA